MNVFLDSLHSALALGPVAQDHLLQARQMQALSFAVHIPLVCFGIAFPVMVLLMEWWGQRTGDPLYRTIARRWSRVMIALFAIGVITGTVLSFEMGVLWPNFTATFGRRRCRAGGRSHPHPEAPPGPRRAPRHRLPARGPRLPHNRRSRVGPRDRRDHAARSARVRPRGRRARTARGQRI